MRNDLEEQARRLIATRVALGYKQQVDFCEEIGVKQNVYNPFENAKRPITLAVAVKIKERFGVPLDWTVCGDLAALPGKISKDYREARRRAA